jgi:hypothetical protein
MRTEDPGGTHDTSNRRGTGNPVLSSSPGCIRSEDGRRCTLSDSPTALRAVIEVDLTPSRLPRVNDVTSGEKEDE